MDQLSSSLKPSKWSGFLHGIKKILKWVLTILVIICCSFVYMKYFYTYSEGYRAGLLQKFSKKGVVFKTYEGELILSSIASSRDITISSEKFLFTVVNKNLIRQFDTLQGQSVIVHYKQKNAAIFWRGDSQYLVDSIKVKK